MKLGKFNNYSPANTPSLQGKQEATAKVEQPSQPLSQPLKSPASDLLKLLQPGQQLDATVVKQLPSQSLLQLQIGSMRLNAQTELKLPAGTPVKLELIKLGAIPEFKIASPLSENSQVISLALKQSLPKQLALSSFINQLQIALSNRQLTAVLPKQINQLLKQFTADIPPKEALIQPNSLKRLVGQSGIFLEKQLAQASTDGSPSPVLQSDRKAKLTLVLNALQNAFKAATSNRAPNTSPAPPTQTALSPELANPKPLPALLLKGSLAGSRPATSTAQPLPVSAQASLSPALAHLKTLSEPLIKGALPTPSTAATVAQQTALLPQLAIELRELISKTEGAIAKIVLDQLSSLPKEESAKQSWQFELPFLSGNTQTDSLKLTITQEDKNSLSEEEESWSVVLEISPPGLGPIYSKIILKGNQVDSYFWSEEASVCDLIESHLGQLASRLNAAGLETGQLGTRNGKPAEATPQKSDSQLVSERA